MSDFQSAYSISPRDSYGEDTTQGDERDELTPTSMETATESMVGGLTVPISTKTRQRAYSNATTVGGSPMDSTTTASDETTDMEQPVSFIDV